MAQWAAYGAGIVHYGSDPGLAQCLASLRAQTVRPARIVVIDHDAADPSDPRRTALQAGFPEVDWIHAPNGGYAAGANRVVEQVLGHDPQLEFVLILNPDVELEAEFAARILAELDSRPEVALASGKLLRPGGRLIDSAGIERRRSRRFFDRGSEEPDDGRYDRVETVFAVSGAALWLRRSALSSLALDGELFDEDFFSYHEDTDLAWRARQLGWRCLYVPTARAIHVRGWRQGARQRVAAPIRRHSFKNRYLELIKNESPLALLLALPFVLPVELARLGFAVFGDRVLLGAYREAFRLAGRARQKRAILRRKRSGRRGPEALARARATGVPVLSGAGMAPIASSGPGLTEGN
ncbi:MAG: glycosyltransferase family 2 protein [Deltaproteobacteria bacterium]|nr:glycosyltransferase family 2 protein [Deltaproteobacteria bacterium]